MTNKNLYNLKEICYRTDIFPYCGCDIPEVWGTVLILMKWSISTF